ncbi:MAG: peptidase M20 [Thermodesulfovibrio sp.]|nr:peptidase M20 [Thermodesulfovibrio sp.]
MKNLINEQRLLKTFLELAEINSPSFSERDIGAFLIKRLEQAGCRVLVQEYQESFNLIGLKQGTRPETEPLLLSAHMDTIEPTEGIRISIDEEMVRSTGDTVLGSDDKSAIAQVLEALDVIREQDLPHGDIEVVFTSAEERGLFGAKNLDYSRIRSRQALVLDSSGSVGKIIVGAPTHITYEMRIVGRPAHAGIEPELGLSAIRVAGAIAAAVPDGRIDPMTTANIGLISGGTATNVVPKEVVLHGEIRSHEEAVLRATRDRIFGTAREIADRYKATLDIREREEYRSFSLSSEGPFMELLKAAFRRCGIEPVPALTGGGSDANIFNQNSIYAVNISTGMQKVHSTDEFILLKDLYDGCHVLLECITAMGDLRHEPI